MPLDWLLPYRATYKDLQMTGFSGALGAGLVGLVESSRALP